MPGARRDRPQSPALDARCGDEPECLPVYAVVPMSLIDNPQPTSRRSIDPRQRRLVVGEFARFVLVGGANTAVAYAVYLFLLHWLRYEFAYAIGYAVGIAIAYALSTTFVFRQPMRKRSAARFPFVYVIQFLVSLGLLRLAVEVFAIPQWLALAVSVGLTLPITFVLSRWIVRAG
jgi:putative flippase GtrA